MVSALWKACSDGDLDQVILLLNDGAQVDLEVKDHDGATALLQAVKNSHVEVVRVLLDKGADPISVLSQGPPERYTSDPAIHHLLSQAVDKTKMPVQENSVESAYPPDVHPEVGKHYYVPPPGPYYYHLPPHMIPEGGVAYYPPLPPPHHMADLHNPAYPNLPPPDVARMIPCRYYPACRYGASCMFAHPGAPYMQGPLPPPAQYPPPFDPMTPGPFPPYYTLPSPSYQTSPNGPPIATSPTLSTALPPPNGAPPPVMHARSPSDAAAAIPGLYNGPAPPVPYPVVPSSYGHPGPIPISIPAHSPVAGPQSPQQVIYTPVSPTAGPGPSQYTLPHSITQPYQHHGVIANANHDHATSPKSPIAHPDADPYGPPHRDSHGHQRRGSVRRSSFGVGRKPPCLFFPAGRCKNGDDCRFPHILPDGSSSHPPFVPRGGLRPRPSIQTNGIAGLEDKFGALAIQQQTDAPPIATPVTNGNNGTQGNNSNGSSRSQSTEPGARGRGLGHKPHAPNGYRAEKRTPAVKAQRVPSADEFPVLGGSSTPPLRSPGAGSVNGWTGLTAAQVLQAPAPPRRDSQPGTRGVSPANGRSAQNAKDEVKPEPNGASATNSVSHQSAKLPISFAAVAAPEGAKEVSVTA